MPKPSPAVVVALIAALGGGLLLLSHYSNRSGSAQITADIGGPIELALVSVSSARSSTLRNAELINNIVNGLPARVRILILAPDRDAFRVAANPWRERIEFVDMPQQYRLTIWPQDPFVVIRDADGARLLASPDFARAEDAEMARVVADHLALPLEIASLSFEGGNIVADEEQVFIGANTIRANALELQLAEAEIAARFQAELGKPVIVVGPVPQPVGHIDMMLTPLGERRLMLADPAWGATLAQRALERQPDTVVEFERRSEQGFFGHSSIDGVSVGAGEIVRAPEIVGTTRLAIGASRALAAQLDTLAVELENLGFSVYRVPYLAREPRLPQALAPGESIPGQPGYPQLTYNNVLLESVDGISRVYLPEYGFATLDEAAREAWRARGYEVVPIPGFTTSAMYGGALRCSTKVLARH